MCDINKLVVVVVVVVVVAVVVVVVVVVVVLLLLHCPLPVTISSAPLNIFTLYFHFSVMYTTTYLTGSAMRPDGWLAIILKRKVSSR